jgi:hypothetical protein
LLEREAEEEDGKRCRCHEIQEEFETENMQMMAAEEDRRRK